MWRSAMRMAAVLCRSIPRETETIDRQHKTRQYRTPMAKMPSPRRRCKARRSARKLTFIDKRCITVFTNLALVGQYGDVDG